MWLTGLIAALSALAIGLSASPSIAADTASQNVALIPGPGPIPAQGLNGIMPTSSYVTGYSSEQFSSFSFSNVGLAQITPTTLAKYDTVALIQVPTSSLVKHPGAEAALAQFVAQGGKLIIHDADETSGNDYSWLLGGTKVGAGCSDGAQQQAGRGPCGSQSGTSTITTNSGIISSNPADASYVALTGPNGLYTFTDQGDANLLVSTDPRWNVLAEGTNSNGESGAEVAYARSGNGLIIYNGFDTDFIKSSPTERNRCAGQTKAPAPYYCPATGAQPTVDWLAHMWYSELAEGGGSSAGIPPATPIVDIGTPISSASAGLPSHPTPGRACVARRSLRLTLNRFAHIRHRKIVQVDVYVNGKHRFRQRRHFRNATVRRLPAHGRYTVSVIATTKRGYHLVAKRRYRGC